MVRRTVQLLAVAAGILLVFILVHFLQASGARTMIPITMDKIQRLPTHQRWCPNPSAPFPTTTPFPANFWYVKTFKTGSTTLSSVFNSICVHYGIVWLRWDTVKNVAQLETEGSRPTPLERGMKEAISSVYAATDIEHMAITSHIRYSDDAARQFRQPLMRFTSVRHPVARVHSHFIQNLCYNTAQAMGWIPGSPADSSGAPGPSACDNGDDASYLQLALRNDTVEHRWEFARKRFQQNMMFWYIQGSTETVEDAADQYDFIFVSERMNEALVIFMLEYGLTFEDIAYLPSKIRTGKYKTAKDMPQELNDYILSVNQEDLQLWELANKRLDQRKAQLQDDCGSDIVTAGLYTFEKLLGEVTAECTDYIEWYKSHGYSEPYTYSGTPGVGDESGLGFRCVRHVARRFMSGAETRAQGGMVKGIV